MQGERLMLVAAIEMDLQPDPVVLLAGGAFRALPEIHHLVAQRIGGRFEVRLLDSDPAWGAQDRGSWDIGTAGSGHVPTERVNPLTEGLDRMSTREILRAMNQQDHLVAPAVGRCLDPIARVVDEAAGRMKGTTGASEPQARRILDRVQWDVASAVLAIRLGDVERTATVLRRHDGNLRAALEELAEGE